MMDCTTHRGHRRYVGGPLDGSTDHLICPRPSDLPVFTGTPPADGTRAWYELDYPASHGTEAVYQFIGCAPQLHEARRAQVS